MSELTPTENPEPGIESPDSDYITIGRIIAPWGAKGEVKVQIETEFPQRFSPGELVFVDGKSMTIADVSWHRDRPILKFSTVDCAEDAQQLRGKSIEIPQSQLHPLPEGHYYRFQLIGLKVVTAGGEPLGEIKEILDGKSNDTYVVQGTEGEILIPAIEDVVRSVDLERGLMEIEPIAGLLELNRKKNG
ncbi:MAG: ribosome maturation factor RimM [Dehalococcoidales bacterium]